MNIPTPIAKRRASRLLEALRAISGGKQVGHMGFRAHDSTQRRAAGLIVSVTNPSRDFMRALLALGIDGIEVQSTHGADLALTRELCGPAGVPVGIDVDAQTKPSDLSGMLDEHIDWLRFGLSAGLDVLVEQRAARVITVPTDVDRHVAAGLNSEIADAVLVEFRSSEREGLILSDGLRLRAVREVVRKPLLAFFDRADSVPPVGAIHSLGIDGLLLRAHSAADLERVGAVARMLGETET